MMTANYTPAQLASMTVAQLNALTASQFSTFTSAQTQALTVAQIRGLKTANFDALNIAYLTKAQIAGINAAEMASVSVANFDKYLAPNLASLAVGGISGITVAQLASMTRAQMTALTSTEIAAMNSASGAFAKGYIAIMKDVAAHLSGGALSFAGAQAILQDAASGGMSAGKLAALQAIAHELNATSGVTIGTTAQIQQLFDDVVLGNAANAHWNGGAATATTLGNLSATSTAMQLNELIGKWFLGSDDPSVAGMGYGDTYKATCGNLFSAAGPVYTDVNQGTDGDCYFDAALAETAYQDPSLIRNMITVNSNGTDTVDFHLNGKNDYVTVNSDLAYMQGGYHMADGSTLAFNNGGASGSKWAAVVEKAYVEFRSQTDGVNSYANISGGWDNGLSAITGQAVEDYYTSGDTASQLGSMLATFSNALSAHQDIMMNTNGGDPALNLVGDHMYSVLAVNAAAGTVTLDNPWNADGQGSGLKMVVADSIVSLAQQGVTFHVAMGAPALA